MFEFVFVDVRPKCKKKGGSSVIVRRAIAAVKQPLLNVKEGNCFTSAESRNRDNTVVLEEVIK